VREFQRRSEGLEVALAEFEGHLPSPLSAGIAAEAARVMARAEAMGLVDSRRQPLDTDFLRVAMRALAEAGIGRDIFLHPRATQDPEAALALLNLSIVESPWPETEWRAVVDVLGPELTGRLTSVSPSSVKRYTTGVRETPDDVANRLHAVALIIADLLGSYNHYGVRRWFERERRALDGASPAAYLSGKWRPEDPGPSQVVALAAGLLSSSAT
jgi:hypothetical protein